MKNDPIASLQNPRVKAAVRLRRRRGRKQADRILIDGLREVGRALEAGVAVEELFYCREMLEADEPVGHGASRFGWLRLLEEARRGGGQVISVTEAVFARIGYGQRADGVVAVARRPCRDLDRLSLPEAALVAVLEGVEKPGNLGAILRTADAAGVEAVIAVEPGVDVYGPNVIRASLGAVFCVPLVEAAADQARAWLRERGFRIVAATPDGNVPYTEVDYRGRTAIVLGAESRGLGGAWERQEMIRAVVPMRGRSDSLNVSATAAVFFYEALRQRGMCS